MRYRRLISMFAATGAFTSLAAIVTPVADATGCLEPDSVAVYLRRLAAAPPCVPDPFTIDLSGYDNTLDKVYLLIPSPWGELQAVVQAVDYNYDEAVRDEEGGGESEDAGTCREGSDNSAVLGGANPPTRTVVYHEATGTYDNYVRGSATLMSCREQDMLVAVRMYVGATRNRWSGWLKVRVPAKRWVTFGSPTLDCDPSADGGHGFAYTTQVETLDDVGGYPVWDNESDSRTWTNC